ncbi:hypothetical protein FJ651_08775, partial [Paucihalobacter ruber]
MRNKITFLALLLITGLVVAATSGLFKELIDLENNSGFRYISHVLQPKTDNDSGNNPFAEDDKLSEYAGNAVNTGNPETKMGPAEVNYNELLTPIDEAEDGNFERGEDAGLLAGDSGIFESYIILDTGSGNQFYDLQAATANPDFTAFSSTFSQSNQLILKGAQNKTFKCNGDDILNGWLNYRIYLQTNTSPPSFNSINLPFKENIVGAGDGCQDQEWELSDGTNDLRNGLPSGDYYLEVYTHADFTYEDPPGTTVVPDFPHTANNGGNNYRATFRADNPPVAVCQDRTITLDASGNVNIVAEDIDNGSSDDFDTPTLSIDITSFNCSNLGPNTVTLTVTDSLGQTDSCTAVVTVVDDLAPIADVATLTDVTAQCEVTALTAPTATDNCVGTVTATHNATLPITTQGTTVVTWTHNDGNGNTSTQTQNVVIDDITAPVADLATLSDVTAECEVTALTPPTATDNCGGVVTVSHNATLPITTQGTTVVTWTYEDVNGNTSQQTQNVVIDDITAPVADLATLSDVTAECEVTALTPPTATDNCGGVVTVSHNATLPITTQGTTVITWTYNDGNGNTSTQTQNVVIDDTTAPVADVATLPDATGECSVTVTAPTATDNCEGTITATTTNPLTYSVQGTYTITWTYNDGNGNTSTQTQTVIVDDTTAPVPDVATLPDATGECSVTVTAPTATDNCEGTITATTTNPLTYSVQGTYTITWTYDDGNGNTSTQTQTVIVDDTTAPVPDVATLPDATGECSVTVTAPTATDNCEGTITATTTNPLTYSVQGTYTITWTYDDGNGNTSTQTQTVIVDDTTAPVPDVATLPDATGECSVTVTAPTASDNCEGTITATTTNPLTYSVQGTYTITWTYNDGNGNTSTQTQTVIVDD